MKNLIVRFLHEEEGQDLIEYVLIATFVSVGALTGATALGDALDEWYDQAAQWVGRSDDDLAAPAP